MHVSHCARCSDRTVRGEVRDPDALDEELAREARVQQQPALLQAHLSGTRAGPDHFKIENPRVSCKTFDARYI